MNIYKLFVVFVLIIILFNNQIFSQKLTNEQARECKKKILIVGLEELNIKDMKDLSTDKLEAYKKRVENKNSILKRVVEMYWKFNSEIKFMPLTQAKTIIENNQKYVLLTLELYQDSETQSGLWISSPHEKVFIPDNKTKILNKIQCLNLEGQNKIYSTNLPKLKYTEADLVFGIMQMQYYLNRLYYDENIGFKEINKECHGNVLRSKTLLICIDDLSKSLKNEDIFKFYPYKLKIASTAEIDTAILNFDSEYIVVQRICSKTGKGEIKNQFFYETSSGEIVAYSTSPASYGFSDVNNTKINKNHLKKFKELAECDKK